MDQGEQSFTIELFGAPEISRCAAATLAEHLNKPLIVTPHVSRSGTAAHKGQWFTATAETSVIGTLKMAEKSNDVICRALELDGQPDSLVISGNAISIPARGLVTARIVDGIVMVSDGLER